MIKKCIYPKTKRVKVEEKFECELTEKLDGSNMCIFKKDEVLYVAQRNNIFTFDEILEMDKPKTILYKGLQGWVAEHKDYLQENLYNNAVLCGEWLGMGCLKYDNELFDKKFYMFAKANITEDFDLKNIYYYHELFIYPFKNQEIPDFIGVVPVVKVEKTIPNKKDLDEIYAEYLEKVNRNVEGIIVNYQNNITKYVRMKNGKLQEHVDSFK